MHACTVRKKDINYKKLDTNCDTIDIHRMYSFSGSHDLCLCYSAECIESIQTMWPRVDSFRVYKAMKICNLWDWHFTFIRGNIIQLVVDSESNIRNYRSRDTCCWTRRKPRQLLLDETKSSPIIAVEAFAESNNRCRGSYHSWCWARFQPPIHLFHEHAHRLLPCSPSTVAGQQVLCCRPVCIVYIRTCTDKLKISEPCILYRKRTYWTFETYLKKYLMYRFIEKWNKFIPVK